MSDEPTIDRHGLEVIGLEECLTLLASRPYGRLAYLDAGAPAIVPVNHLVDGSSVVIRSLDGGKLGAAIFERPVAFQLDDLDFTTRTGWSVLVRGRAEIVEDADAEELREGPARQLGGARRRTHDVGPHPRGRGQRSAPHLAKVEVAGSNPVIRSDRGACVGRVSDRIAGDEGVDSARMSCDPGRRRHRSHRAPCARPSGHDGPPGSGVRDSRPVDLPRRDRAGLRAHRWERIGLDGPLLGRA
jgi:uncharacterized protein